MSATKIIECVDFHQVESQDQKTVKLLPQPNHETATSHIFSRKSLLKMAISFVIAFGINFGAAYLTTDGDERYIFEGSSAAYANLFLSSILAGFIVPMIEFRAIQQKLEELQVECPFVIDDVDESASRGLYYWFPSLKISNVWLRAFCFALQDALYFGVPGVFLMLFACWGHLHCSLSKAEYSCVIAFFITFQNLVMYPIVFMSVLYASYSKSIKKISI